MRNKYGNKRTQVGERTFASKREANRFLELQLLEKSGQIECLELQPKFPIVVNGMKCGVYIADFRFMEGGKTIIEDVKSKPTMTAVYRLKKRLVRALYGIDIVEV